MKYIQAEIEYQRKDGTLVHSDIEPAKCDFNNINTEYKKYLHKCLEEWLNNSNGTGCFYIKDIDFKILHFDKNGDMITISESDADIDIKDF